MVRTPSLALLRSTQPLLSVLSHIEPVRSIATTMSTGVDEQGLQAFACVVTVKCLRPNIPANELSVVVEPVTRSSFGLTAALHPAAMIAVVVHFRVYVNVKGGRFP